MSRVLAADHKLPFSTTLNDGVLLYSVAYCQIDASANVETFRFQKNGRVKLTIVDIRNDQAQVVGFTGFEFKGGGHHLGVTVVLDVAQVGRVRPGNAAAVGIIFEFVVDEVILIGIVVDGVDRNIILAPRHQGYINGLIAKRAIDTWTAYKKTKNVVEVGPHKLAVFFRGKNVAKGDY